LLPPLVLLLLLVATAGMPVGNKPRQSISLLAPAP
jgi:hypothetical protein